MQEEPLSTSSEVREGAGAAAAREPRAARPRSWKCIVNEWVLVNRTYENE